MASSAIRPHPGLQRRKWRRSSWNWRRSAVSRLGLWLKLGLGFRVGRTAVALGRAVASGRLPSSIAVQLRARAAAVYPAARTSPRSFFTSPRDRTPTPTRSGRSLGITGTGGHTGGVHESTLVYASPVDRPPTSLRSTTLIGSRVARFVSAHPPTNRTSLAFQNLSSLFR